MKAVRNIVKKVSGRKKKEEDPNRPSNHPVVKELKSELNKVRRDKQDLAVEAALKDLDGRLSSERERQIKQELLQLSRESDILKTRITRVKQILTGTAPVENVVGSRRRSDNSTSRASLKSS